MLVTVFLNLGLSHCTSCITREIRKLKLVKRPHWQLHDFNHQVNLKLLNDQVSFSDCTLAEYNMRQLLNI